MAALYRNPIPPTKSIIDRLKSLLEFMNYLTVNQCYCTSSSWCSSILCRRKSFLLHILRQPAATNSVMVLKVLNLIHVSSAYNLSRNYTESLPRQFLIWQAEQKSLHSSLWAPKKSNPDVADPHAAIWSRDFWRQGKVSASLEGTNKREKEETPHLPYKEPETLVRSVDA